MKHLFTLFILMFSFTAFSQNRFKDKFDQADKAFNGDSTKVDGDTIKIDLVPFGAFNKLRAIENERMKIQSEAMVLQERNKGLDAQQGNILDAEYQHSSYYDPKREVIGHQVVGTELVIVLKRLQDPCSLPGAKCVEMDKKKKKP